MNAKSKITFIDEVEIRKKRVLLRADFNVPITDGLKIAHDARIKQTIPTLKHLLKTNNRIIIIAHLGRPKRRESKFSLKPVVARLKELLPEYKFTLIDDFLNQQDEIEKQKDKEVLVLENIRYYPQESENDEEFAKKLSALGDVYVNDAFGVSHRSNSSLVALPHLLPSYGGLLLKKEVEMVGKAIEHPKKPFIAILGGGKVVNKIKLVDKLLDVADYVLLGGRISIAFLAVQGELPTRTSKKKDELEAVQKFFTAGKKKNTRIVLPRDVVVGDPEDDKSPEIVKKLDEVTPSDTILDIGPQTEAVYGSFIAQAKTIIWNGPMGYFENPAFARGTEFIYYALTQNSGAISIVGGGDTLAAISQEEYLGKITHISTGGGAMLEFIEKGTLPALEALKK